MTSYPHDLAFWTDRRRFDKSSIQIAETFWVRDCYSTWLTKSEWCCVDLDHASHYGLFMPPDRMIGAYCFCLVCLFVSMFVCLCVVNFDLRYNFWTVRDRDFIFGVHTPLMTSFQWVCDLDFDLEAKNNFLDFVAAGGIVFHKHTFLIFNVCIYVCRNLILCDFSW